MNISALKAQGSSDQRFGYGDQAGGGSTAAVGVTTPSSAE